MDTLDMAVITSFFFCSPAQLIVNLLKDEPGDIQ